MDTCWLFKSRDQGWARYILEKFENEVGDDRNENQIRNFIGQSLDYGIAF